MNNNFYKRLAQVEATTAATKAELEETLKAAALARKIRNKLLDNSDSQMTLDRLGLDTSTATKFIHSLTNIFTGAWATYRQALRDLPEQGGFPFNIEFPTPPDAEEGSENESI